MAAYFDAHPAMMLQSPWLQAWQSSMAFAREDPHVHWGSSGDWPYGGRYRHDAWPYMHDAWSQRQRWHAEKYDASWGSDASGSGSSLARALPEEPGDVLLVNSASSGAYSSLCADAADADLVAFDAEWAPDYHFGSDNPVSVLQLAFPISQRVYVLQLRQLGNKLPPAVQMMLVNPGVTKVGFGSSDGPKFRRSGIALTKGSVVDVQSWSATALRLNAAPETLSLKHAANSILDFRLAKDRRCTCSDWASETLTPEQIHYAALDAWVALRLYYAVAG